MAGRLWMTFLTVPILNPAMSVTFDPIGITWLQEICTDTDMKLAVTSWLQTLDRFLLCWNTSLDATVEQMLKCQSWLYGGLIHYFFCADMFLRAVASSTQVCMEMIHGKISILLLLLVLSFLTGCIRTLYITVTGKVLVTYVVFWQSSQGTYDMLLKSSIFPIHSI